MTGLVAFPGSPVTGNEQLLPGGLVVAVGFHRGTEDPDCTQHPPMELPLPTAR